MDAKIPTSTTDLSTTYSSTFYESYSDHNYLARGGFGKVFEATEKLSDRKVAIKRVKLKTGTEQNILKELKVQSKLYHDNVLHYYNSWIEPFEYHKERDEKLFSGSDISESSSSITNDVFSQMNKNSNDESLDTTSTHKDQTEEKQKAPKSYAYLFIVTSLCKKKSLSGHLLDQYDSTNKIDRIDALHIFYQIMSGVTYLHNEKEIIHRDLKPANILFSLDNNTVKIADFGLALWKEDLVPVDDCSNVNETDQVGGTKFYMPPSTESTSYKADMYALGIILFELLYSFSSGSERIEVLKNIRKPDIIFPSDFEEKCGNELLRKLIRRSITHSTDERPTANDLNENIQNDIGVNDFKKLEEKKKVRKTLKANEDMTASKIENVLNSSVVKELPLVTGDIQYGVYDVSDQYLLLSDNKTLKLYDINCDLINEYSGLHDSFIPVGNIQRIVWCQSLEQFFIVCEHYLYAFTPGERSELSNMAKINFINQDCRNNKLRFITCTNKHIFINYSYHTIKQYNIPTWFLYREWSKEKLNYKIEDDIRRTTCSTTNDYIAFNIRSDRRIWTVDFRSINDDLTLLKTIEMPNLGIYHNLQLSSCEWLVRDENDKFYVVDISKEEINLKIIQTNINSRSDIYTRFFGDYFIVPIIENQANTRQLQGIIRFYQWS